MFWWLLLAALGAALIVLWVLRSETRQRPTRPKPPKPGAKPKAPTRPKSARPKSARPKAPATPGTGPQPGEIWWADVPYEDYSGHKVRPCVVIRVDGVHREVLKITSQDQSHRDDHVRIPTKTWDPGADHDSYLDLTGPVLVAVQEFEDQAGTLDPAIWRKVKQLYKLA